MVGQLTATAQLSKSLSVQDAHLCADAELMVAQLADKPVQAREPERV
jgi:hypothetical protein